MSYFMQNNCKYKNCGRHFDNLDDLIIHIEDTHIDFDPQVMEEAEKQKLQFIPMSYVLRYNRGERKESVKVKEEMVSIENIKTEPSDVDPVLTENEDCYKNPNWHPEAPSKDDGTDIQKGKTKRFSCPVEGCTKRYKNQNGMKYHITNYHDMNGNLIKPKKEHKCHCGREYKTIRGLQAHMVSHKDPVMSPKPLMSFKMHPTFPSLMPKMNSNCMLPSLYPPPDNYSHLIIQNEDHQLSYSMGRNILSNESPSTIIRSQIFPNPYYPDYGYENPNDIFIKTE